MSFINKIFNELSKSRLFTGDLFHIKVCKNHMTTSMKYEIIKPWKVSKMRQVPDNIVKPPYYYTSIAEQNENVEIKNHDQITRMRESCKLAKEILKNVKSLIKPGVTTDYVDEQTHQMIINNNAYPSPLNYKGFPKSICTSINNVVCHGIPDSRPLQLGDILNVDITVYINGYHGDCSEMFTVKEPDDNAKQLINVTKLCLDSAINICKPDENFSSIGTTIEEIANKHGFTVIPALVGHGIGSYFHGAPAICHFANDEPGKMQAGMTFTIEPVLSEGGPEIILLEDDWTLITADDARTAQEEHTILITDYGCDVLTS